MTERPCWVEICIQSFEDNFRYLNRLAAGHAELLAVVKSDAYGHSLQFCAPAAVRAGAKWLGVTSTEEGIVARALCPDARTLIMAGCFSGEGSAVLRHALTPVVWEPWHLDVLEGAATAAGAGPGSVAVHLEMDTGMSRQGAAWSDLPSLLVRFGAKSPLRLEGVFTHLLAPDETDGRATDVQMARLEETLVAIQRAGIKPEWLSVGSSASLLSGAASRMGALAARWGMKVMIRPGLSLYGVAPQFEPDEPDFVAAARAILKPVMSWKTQVVSVRTVQAGTVVGYNGTFVAAEPMRLALIAAGYADGLVRALGNNFSLLVRGERAPLVGRISMDQAVIDVTEIAGVEDGDEVVILGRQGSETIAADDHAAATATISWEVLTRIGARVRRVPV